jgi:hypothetical protein
MLTGTSVFRDSTAEALVAPGETKTVESKVSTIAADRIISFQRRTNERGEFSEQSRLHNKTVNAKNGSGFVRGIVSLKLLLE